MLSANQGTEKAGQSALRGRGDFWTAAALPVMAWSTGLFPAVAVMHGLQRVVDRDDVLGPARCTRPICPLRRPRRRGHEGVPQIAIPFGICRFISSSFMSSVGVLFCGCVLHADFFFCFLSPFFVSACWVHFVFSFPLIYFFSFFLRSSFHGRRCTYLFFLCAFF